MILTTADAMKSSGMQAAGYNYIMLDDCWAWITRDRNGDLQADPDRFPRGMPALINDIHDRGLKIGLYTSAGPLTCSAGGRPAPIPGSWNHSTQDARLFARWQVDAVKLDMCNWRPPNPPANTIILPDQAAREMYLALNATGRPTWLSFHCVGYGILPNQWCADYGNSFRITTDHKDNWESTYAVIQALANHPGYAGRYAWPDPDFLMTGGAGCENLTAGMRCPGMTAAEYRTEFGIWSIAGGQLVVSTDVRNMSALQADLLLNHEILDVFNDPLAELGKRTVWDLLSQVSVWVRRLEPVDGHPCAAVLVFNEGNKTLPAYQVGYPSPVFDSVIPDWPAGASMSVRDLYRHADLPPQHSGVLHFPPNIVSHGSEMWKICALPKAATMLDDGKAEFA